MECVLPRVIEIGSAGNAFWNTPRNISVKHSPCPQVVEQVRRADTRARARARTQMTLGRRTMRMATKEAVAVATPYLEPLATSTCATRAYQLSMRK